MDLYVIEHFHENQFLNNKYCSARNLFSFQSKGSMTKVWPKVLLLFETLHLIISSFVCIIPLLFDGIRSSNNTSIVLELYEIKFKQSAHYWFLAEMIKILTFFWPNFDINADQNLTFLNVNSDFEFTNEENSNIIVYRIMNIDYLKVTFIVNLESKFKNLTFLVKCRPFSDQFC